MTPEENEEFNRIEMESRIKQEYVRAMRKKVDDDFEREYSKWEHSPKHQMFKLMDELAVARVLIRELGDRLAKLEKPWVGLTDDEIDQGLLRSDYAFKTAEAWRAGVVFAMTKLKEKNT